MMKNPFLLPDMNPEWRDERQEKYTDICYNPMYGPIARKIFVDLECLRALMKQDAMTVYDYSSEQDTRAEKVVCRVTFPWHISTYTLTTHEQGIQSNDLQVYGYDLHVSENELASTRGHLLFEKDTTIRAIDCGGGEFGLFAASVDTLAHHAQVGLQVLEGVDMEAATSAIPPFTQYDAEAFMQEIGSISRQIAVGQRK